MSNPARHIAIAAGLVMSSMTAVGAQESSSEGDIGYPSVDAARNALLERDDVHRSTSNGWLTVEDPVNKTIWTFAPENDPAHPAAVKRRAVEEFDRVVIVMDIRCEGDIAACDALEEHFLNLNQAARDDVERQNQPEN